MLGLDAMGGKQVCRFNVATFRYFHGCWFLQVLSQSLTGIVTGHAWWLLLWRDTAGKSTDLVFYHRCGHSIV